MPTTSPIEFDLDLPAGMWTVTGHIEWDYHDPDDPAPRIPPATVIDTVDECAEVPGKGYWAPARTLDGAALEAFMAEHGQTCRERIEAKVEAMAERHAEQMADRPRVVRWR